MVGAGGSFSTFDYPNPSDSAGLSNSNASGATAFYDRRLSRSQYLGLGYQYGRTTSNGLEGQTTTDTNSLLPFYTLYFSRTASFSISAGIEHTSVQQAQSPVFKSWSPEAAISMGWQSSRANLAAYYSYTVTSGGGLVGAFTSNSAGVSAGYKLTRSWSVALSASYVNSNTVSPQIVSYGEGGNTASGQASLSRMFGERIGVGFGYERLHEDFSGIKVISENPDSYQEYARFTYQFRKALGR